MLCWRVARALRPSWYYAQRVIAEISPEFYDVQGRRVFAPGTRAWRAGFRPTAHMGRYLAHPLKTHCKDFTENSLLNGSGSGRVIGSDSLIDSLMP